MPEMHPVKSSNVDAIGHDADAGEIHVRFKGGATWAYPDCTADDFEAMRTSTSVGTHVAQQLIPAKGRGRKI